MPNQTRLFPLSLLCITSWLACTTWRTCMPHLNGKECTTLSCMSRNAYANKVFRYLACENLPVSWRFAQMISPDSWTKSRASTDTHTERQGEGMEKEEESRDWDIGRATHLACWLIKGRHIEPLSPALAAVAGGVAGRRGSRGRRRAAVTAYPGVLCLNCTALWIGLGRIESLLRA